MCFHTESEMSWFLNQVSSYSAIIMRRPDDRFVAAFLIDPTQDEEIPILIASLREWHPIPDAVFDLSLLNRARLWRRLPEVNEAGLPVYRGPVPPSAEETAIGRELRELFRQFARGEYEVTPA